MGEGDLGDEVDKSRITVRFAHCDPHKEGLTPKKPCSAEWHYGGLFA